MENKRNRTRHEDIALSRCDVVPPGNPLSQTRYALQRRTGAFEYGTTDELGQTHLLASVPHAENITIYLAQ